MSRYDDIINIDHFEPKHHPRMSKENRAAQFSPFAALAGYEDVIKEQGRETDMRLELDEYRKAEINASLNFFKENKNEKIIITYFVKDEKKNGGTYLELETTLKKIDEDKRLLITIDNTVINIDDIYNIEF